MWEVRLTESLKRVLAYAEQFLSGLEETPVASRLEARELKARLEFPLPQQGTNPQIVIDELIAAADDGVTRNAGARFYGWVMGGALPSSLAADWLVSVWDQNAATVQASPAAAVIEDVCASWVKELLELPKEASFAFTTGCQMAHATCLAAARNALLLERGWDVEKKGLNEAPRVRILTAERRHGSVDRAVRLLGFGTDSIERLAEDRQQRLCQKALHHALQQSSEPAIAILHAGDLNVGAFDDFDRLIPIAKEFGAWVHIDGAFGLWVKASRKLRHLGAGVELADSWATDTHKWLNVPYDNGLAIVRDSGAHRRAMKMDASYVASSEEHRDPIDYTPEWSRRARGFPVYAALRELGRDGIEELLDRTCALARELVEGIGSLPQAHMLSAPQINQGLVAFIAPGTNDPAKCGRFTAEVVAQVVRDGEAFFTDTVFEGQRSMRVSLCNWRTSRADVDRSIAAVARAIDTVTGRWRN